MNKNVAIIFIPGLGDANPKWQARAVKLWHIYGYKSQLIAMNWNDKLPWSEKQKKLLDKIDELSNQNYKIVLVGASAGSTAVINAYAIRKSNILGVITIAAKINRPETLGDRYYTENPSFIQSISKAQQSLSELTSNDKNIILCIYSLRDGLVSMQDSIIEGANTYKTWVPYHPLVIGYYLTFGFGRIHRFIKSRS